MTTAGYKRRPGATYPEGPGSHPSAGSLQADSADIAEPERKRLLAAAIQVLERSGWWGFKVEGVLRQAGLSTRSFYRHFEKKSDLLLALLEMELSGAAAALRKRTAAAESPADKVRTYVTTTIDMAYREELAKRSSLFGSHWRELLPEYHEEIGRCTQALIAPLAEAIAAGVASGEFTSKDPRADARAIFHLVAGLTGDLACGMVTPRAEVEHMLLPFIGRAIGLAPHP